MTDDLIKRAEDEMSLHPSLAVRGRWKEAYYALIARVKELEARAEKAEAALALRVEVKPLEWEGDGHWSHGPDEGWMEEANTPFGWGYSIEFDNSGKGSFVACSTFGETLAGFDTPVEAKAAAQADYDARILSAIEPADPATIRAEALRPEKIAEIERGNARWHGEVLRSVRWEPYKPDGKRQMRTNGRWQEMVGSGDFWRWSNCERPSQVLALIDKEQDQ